MDHSTCDNVLDTWNIDKKEHLCAVGYEKAPGFVGHACEVKVTFLSQILTEAFKKSLNFGFGERSLRHNSRRSATD